MMKKKTMYTLILLFNSVALLSYFGGTMNGWAIPSIVPYLLLLLGVLDLILAFAHGDII